MRIGSKKWIVPLVLCLVLLIGCGTPELEPRDPAYIEVLVTDYWALHNEKADLQVELALLKVQYKELGDKHDKLFSQVTSFNLIHKGDYENLAEEYRELLSQRRDIVYALQLINSKSDSAINRYYPSDNETAKARWDIFYELWDRWWADFKYKL